MYLDFQFPSENGPRLRVCVRIQRILPCMSQAILIIYTFYFYHVHSAKLRWRQIVSQVLHMQENPEMQKKTLHIVHILALPFFYSGI